MSSDVTQQRTGPAHAVRRYAGATFASLGNRNYRLYFIGQSISFTGTFMQSVAQSWLVLEITRSGSQLGAVLAMQYLPVLLLAPYGGVLADRFSKRRILLLTQVSLASVALLLGTLAATGLVRLWMVYTLAACFGIINAVDNPTRHSFIPEMVGGEDLRNAVTLNAIEINLARILGPAIAGALIALVGLAPCFIFNGISFLAVLVCLLLMRGTELHRAKPLPAAKGQLREGFRYVVHTRVLRDVLVMMALVGTLTYEFSVSLPLIARFTFHGGAGSYAGLMSAMGVGAVAGGLIVARQKHARIGALAAASFAFGAAVLLVAIAPSYWFAVAGMLVVGGFSTPYTSLTNTIMQTRSQARMRGRVMSLWTVGFLGSTLVGAPIVGWVGEHVDPRWALAVGGLAAVSAGFVGLFAARAREREAREELEHVAIAPPPVVEKEDYV